MGPSITRFLTAAIFLAPALVPAPPAPAKPWMTCDWVEDKGGDCVAGEAPHSFEYYLHPESWDKRHFDLPSEAYAKLKPEWREIGKLGTYAIRAIRYSSEEFVCGNVVLAERGASVFVPLMWWAAKIEPPAIHRANGVQVLAMSREFESDIPAVETWAWVWGPDGIARLNVRGAKDDAIHRISPDYTAYDAAMNWETLQLTSGAWKDDWPGKGGVKATVQAWFEIRGVELAAKRVILEEDGKTRVWP